MTTPILTAALARKPRRNLRAVQQARGEGEGKKSAHNYLAQAPKKKAGAPLGNRNAARVTPQQVERWARLDALVQHLSHEAAAAIALAASIRAGRRMALALLAEADHG